MKKEVGINTNKIVSIYNNIPIETDFCDIETTFQFLTNNMMTIKQMLNDSFFDEFRLDVSNIPFCELLSKEEIYYLPSIQNLIQQCERTAEITKRKTFEDIVSSPSTYEITKNLDFEINDIQERKEFNESLFKILDKNLTEKSRNDEINQLVSQTQLKLNKKRSQERIYTPPFINSLKSYFTYKP